MKGLIKETNKCEQCEIKTYSFSCYFFANVDLSKNQEEEGIGIEQKLKETIEFKSMMFCNKCLQKVEHSCTYEYYTFPKLLIISIQRGISEINKVKINLKDSLELNDLDNKAERKYKLVALIVKTNKTDDKKEKYYSHFCYKNQWFHSERSQQNKPIKSPFENLNDQQNKPIKRPFENLNDQQNQEDIVMLFYAPVIKKI